MLELQALKTVAAVIETGSFAAAGRHLGYSTSAISQQMSALERSLGLQLFERGAHSVRPTEAARYLSERSGELIGLLAQVESEMARISNSQAGRLRIGSFASAGAQLLAPAIARFLVRRRDVEVSLDEGEPYEIIPSVVRGQLDVALVFRYDLVPVTWPHQLRVMNLMTEPLYVIASRRHRLAKQELISINQLRDETWIEYHEGTYIHSCLLALGALAGFQPNIAYRSNNLDVIHGLVQASLGVAMIPRLAYRRDPGLIALPVADDLPQRHIEVINRQLDKDPLVQSFLRVLQDIAQAITAP